MRMRGAEGRQLRVCKPSCEHAHVQVAVHHAFLRECVCVCVLACVRACVRTKATW